MATFTYQIAKLPKHDPTLTNINAANADFVGKSPELEMIAVPSGSSVPMRRLRPGDVIVFDLSQLEGVDGSYPNTTWNCAQRFSNANQDRTLMGPSNSFPISHQMPVTVNNLPMEEVLEHWGMWAEIRVPFGTGTLFYSTADPEGVIGNGV